MTFDDAAIEVMLEQGETEIWFGNLGLWQDIYERRYGGGNNVRTRNPHPMNRAQAVFDALRRSKKFKRVGRIRSIGWSGRETLHPVFRITSDRDGTLRRPEGAEGEACQPGPCEDTVSP